MNTTFSSASPSAPTPPTGERALVLHGGGSAGNAWEIGVIAGLFDGGMDVTHADLMVGTSAGATAAAQITSAPTAALLDAILNAAPTGLLGAGGSSVARRAPGMPPARPPMDHMERTSRIIAEAADAADMRRS